MARIPAKNHIAEIEDNRIDRAHGLPLGTKAANKKAASENAALKLIVGMLVAARPAIRRLSPLPINLGGL